jgi:hypothetical protein
MQELSLFHELKLVSEIVAVIERYNTDNGIDAHPVPLRDTMLKVAAMLHSEAARLENSNQNFQPLRDSFLERADECLTDVSLASPAAIGLLQ